MATDGHEWKTAIIAEWKRRFPDPVPNQPAQHFPLIERTFDQEEIIRMIEVFLSGQLTMHNRVKEFEAAFAQYIGAPYAVFVNSGSSANLLALAAIANPVRQNHLKAGDEVLVPAVCWSTTVWPVIQMNLKPVLVDVDPNTMNVCLEDLQRKITPRTKAMVAVHVLGNATNMAAFMKIIRDNHIILVEDTCESLGVMASGKMVGTHGDFGTYSFFFSHHMTTGEGGMVVCQTQEDVDLLRCLRAHGWTRELSNKTELEAKFSDVDPRFLFVNVGYNVRPMECQAVMGLVQLTRINQLNHARVENHRRLLTALRAHPKFSDQFSFPVAGPEVSPVWFGFCFVLNEVYAGQKQAYIDYLLKSKVENRPIVSGNFARQPGLKLYGIEVDPNAFPGAEKLTKLGLFIGLHATHLPDVQVQQLADILLGFNFKKRPLEQ